MAQKSIPYCERSEFAFMAPVIIMLQNAELRYKKVVRLVKILYRNVFFTTAKCRMVGAKLKLR